MWRLVLDIFLVSARYAMCLEFKKKVLLQHRTTINHEKHHTSSLRVTRDIFGTLGLRIERARAELMRYT